MRFLSKKWNAAFLILLFIGSFILHPRIHGSGRCVHEGYSGRQISAISLENSRSECCRPAEPVCISAEFFCPVCAGWLTADCPERTEFEPVCRSSQPDITAAGAPSVAPDCRLPSPRAPPVA
ncbi:MAG: hypothetical protein IJS14_15115 [Lentisphaeria bacterium]|nr:hypothetical protein [Lentisphaeria bacterium]